MRISNVLYKKNPDLKKVNLGSISYQVIILKIKNKNILI